MYVPPNGIGLFEVVEVMAGAADSATDGTAPPELPLIVPPEDFIDCQLPSVPEYVYCDPVE